MQAGILLCVSGAMDARFLIVVCRALGGSWSEGPSWNIPRLVCALAEGPSRLIIWACRNWFGEQRIEVRVCDLMQKNCCMDRLRFIGHACDENGRIASPRIHTVWLCLALHRISAMYLPLGKVSPNCSFMDFDVLALPGLAFKRETDLRPAWEPPQI